MCYHLYTSSTLCTQHIKAPNIFYLHMIQQTDSISYGGVQVSENNTVPQSFVYSWIQRLFVELFLWAETMWGTGGVPSTRRCTQNPFLRAWTYSSWSHPVSVFDIGWHGKRMPTLAWANLCSSSLPSNLRDNAISMMVHPVKKVTLALWNFMG